MIELSKEHAQRFVQLEGLLQSTPVVTQSLAEELTGHAERLSKGLESTTGLVQEAATVLRASSVEMAAVAGLFHQSVERGRKRRRPGWRASESSRGLSRRAGRGAAADALGDQLASTQRCSRGSFSSSASCSSSYVCWRGRASARCSDQGRARCIRLRKSRRRALPVWAAFGDLMACLLGVFVLFFVWIVCPSESALANDLESRAQPARSRHGEATVLESALAGPLRAGLITFVDGRIGVRGSVLLTSNSAELRGRAARCSPRSLGLSEPISRAATSRSWSVALPTTCPCAGCCALTATTGSSAPNARSRSWVRSPRQAWRRLVFAAGFGQNHPVASDEQRRTARAIAAWRWLRCRVLVRWPLAARLTTTRFRTGLDAWSEERPLSDTATQEAPDAIEVERALDATRGPRCTGL